MKTKTTQAYAKFRINLSAIVYRESGFWLAHCLELDIVGEGRDAADAVRTLMPLCDLQIGVAIEEGDLQSIFRAAPPEIWKLYASGTELPLPGKKHSGRSNGFNSPVSRFETRELVLA
jgi:hypothetical protein